MSAKNDGKLDSLSPPCMYCENLIFAGGQTSLTGWRCKAFKEEIPYPILTRKLKHTEKGTFDFSATADNVDIMFKSKEYPEYDDKGNQVIYKITFEGKWYKVKKGE